MATAIRATEAEIKALMPNQIIPPIGSATARPTWQEIATCHEMCSANAARIPSDGGDGQLGHIHIVVGDTRYTELSINHVAYIVPPQAGTVPIYPVGANMYQKDEIKREHIKRDVAHYTYHAVARVVTQMALDAVHENYKSEFYTPELGYRTTYNELMTSLNSEHGKKTSTELDANNVEMKQPWDCNHPIQALYNRMDKVRRFDPTITEEAIVRQVVKTICVHPGFATAYAEWNKKVDADKMWVNLKEHFGEADTTRRELLLLHAPQASATYPGSANSVSTTTIMPDMMTATRLVTAIENMLCTLTTQGITDTNAAATRNGRRQGNATAGTTAAVRTPRTTNPEGGRVPTAAEAAFMSWCWSHGYCKKQAGKPDHTCETCDRPRVGHQPTANASNQMGGETRICNSWRTQRE
jgi:hypothetical protein